MYFKPSQNRADEQTLHNPFCTTLVETCQHNQARMTSTHVLNLPTELLSSVLSDWLDVKCIARLDSSLCCRAGRAHFLSILPTCVLSTTPRQLKKNENFSSSFPQHKWIVEKKIRVNEVMIGLHDGKHLVDEHLPVYTELFKLSADTLQDLHLFSLEDNIMKCILCGCKQLRSLHIGDCVADTLLFIIRDSPHLTLLRIVNTYPHYIPWSDEALRENLLNNHIAKLSITGNVFCNEMLMDMTRLMPHLQSLQLEGVCEEEVENVFDSTYVEICKNCSNLKHISFHNFTMMDSTFTEIVTTLTDLQSVHLPSLSEMTDESIEALMRHHAHSLQNLCLEECDDITLDITKQLLGACTNLRTLHLVDYHRSDVTDLLQCATFADLVELHVASDTCTSDFLGGSGVLRQCKNLQILGLTFTRVDANVAEDLVAIYARFQSLRKLVLYGTDSMEKKLRKIVGKLPLPSILEFQNHPTFDVLSF